MREIWLSSLAGHDAPELLEWVDNDHLLLNGADLVDIPHRIVLWHYEVPGQEKTVECVVNGHLGFGYGQMEMEGGAAVVVACCGQVFFSFPLPHPEAVQAAEGLSEENLVALKAGSQVSADLHVPTANPQDTDALTASYTEQLKGPRESRRVRCPAHLSSHHRDGKSETVTYHAMGMGGNETANVAVQISRLALVENGKVLWENSARTGGAWMFVHHKADETVQSALDRGNQESAMSFFRRISLPGCVAQQGEHGAYGFSKVTPMGPIRYEPAK